LATLFLRAGFEPIDIAERYDGQFLTIEAKLRQDDSKPDLNPEWKISNIRQLIEKFQNVYTEKLYTWKSILSELESQNNRIVIWGAGSKGISFVNNLNISYKQIEYMVDINPRKRGKFVPGTGQCIVEPDFLKEYHPQTTIIMNPIYQREIKATVQQLRIATNFLIG
jgi:hypothetical protein